MDGITMNVCKALLGSLIIPSDNDVSIYFFSLVSDLQFFFFPQQLGLRMNSQLYLSLEIHQCNMSLAEVFY